MCFLPRPMRIAVLGEGNSGKSLLINYLLKHQVLPSGGFSGDSTELLIRYAGEPSVNAVNAEGGRNRLTSKAFGRLIKPDTRSGPVTTGFIYDSGISDKGGSRLPERSVDLVLPARSKAHAHSRLIEVGLPLAFLKRVELIEVRAFPGKAANASSRAFASVDATVWCTLATQAWKETEILAWKSIPQFHRKSALMLVTYKDAIRNEKDETKILARLRHAASSLFNGIVLVSLRDAVQSLLSPGADAVRHLRSDSNIEAAEKALIAMIGSWQVRRLRRASRILQRVASIVSNFPPDRDRTLAAQLLARLGRLANTFLTATPLVSLSNKAA